VSWSGCQTLATDPQERLPEIAVRGLKARGLRMVAAFLSAGCAAAVPREVVGGNPGDLIRDLMLGRHGLDIDDPKPSPVLRALSGRIFSALQLICIMYAGFNRIEPGMDIGVDLAEEWGDGGESDRREERESPVAGQAGRSSLVGSSGGGQHAPMQPQGQEVRSPGRADGRDL